MQVRGTKYSSLSFTGLFVVYFQTYLKRSDETMYRISTSIKLSMLSMFDPINTIKHVSSSSHFLSQMNRKYIMFMYMCVTTCPHVPWMTRGVVSTRCQLFVDTWGYSRGGLGLTFGPGPRCSPTSSEL